MRESPYCGLPLCHPSISRLRPPYSDKALKIIVQMMLITGLLGFLSWAGKSMCAVVSMDTADLNIRMSFPGNSSEFFEFKMANCRVNFPFLLASKFFLLEITYTWKQY